MTFTALSATASQRLFDFGPLECGVLDVHGRTEFVAENSSSEQYASD